MYIKVRRMTSSKRRMPHFEKILIGPCMVLGEMVCAGHYMESLKILKQSSNQGGSYSNIISGLWRKHRFRGFYLGFYPWGVSQIVKGLPILFVQAETHHCLKSYTPFSESMSMMMSGVFGGMTQGLFITPTQRIKTIVLTYPMKDNRRLSPLEVIKETYRRGGFRTFYSGIMPTVFRRGLDWGLRFQGYHWMKQRLSKEKITLVDKMKCGVTGGVLATMTMPVDVCVAKSQKYSNKGKSLKKIIKEIVTYHGWRGFVRGWGIRVIHSCYHTCWVCGIGSVMFDLVRGIEG